MNLRHRLGNHLLWLAIDAPPAYCIIAFISTTILLFAFIQLLQLFGLGTLARTGVILGLNLMIGTAMWFLIRGSIEARRGPK